MRGFSIVIPALNEANYLPRLLRSLAAQTFDGDFEVIVVDGHSTDNTVALAKTFQAKLPQLQVISHSKGVSRQRNAGAKLACYDQLIFLDADVVVPSNFLQTVAARLPKEAGYVIMPCITPDNHNALDYFFGLLAYICFALVSRWRPVATGMCLITSRQSHERIGGFNEACVMAEDVDYGLRSVRAGSTYHLRPRIRLTASDRRIRQTGPFKLGLTWFRAYLYTIKHGPITDPRLFDYEFGRF